MTDDKLAEGNKACGEFPDVGSREMHESVVVFDVRALRGLSVDWTWVDLVVPACPAETSLAGDL